MRRLLFALLFPLLLWLAARCRPVFGALAAFIVTLTMVGTTTFDVGHFFDADLPIDDRIVASQISILVTSLWAFVLSALFAERRRNEEALREGQARLQEALTAGEVGDEPRARFAKVNVDARRVRACERAHR